MPATKTNTSNSVVRKALQSTAKVAVNSIRRLRSMGTKNEPSNSLPTAIASVSIEPSTRRRRRRVKAQALPTAKQPLHADVANNPDPYDLTEMKKALPSLAVNELEPTGIIAGDHAIDEAAEGPVKPVVSPECTVVTDATFPGSGAHVQSTPALTHASSPSPSPPSTPLARGVVEDEIEAVASSLKKLSMSGKVAALPTFSCPEPAKAGRKSFLDTVLNCDEPLPRSSPNDGLRSTVIPFSTTVSELAGSPPRPVEQVPHRLPSSLTDGFVHGPRRTEVELPVSTSHSSRVSLQQRIKEKRAAGRADPYTRARVERSSRKTHLPPGAYMEGPNHLWLSRIRPRNERAQFEALPPLYIVLAEPEAERNSDTPSPSFAPCIPLPPGWELEERYDEDIDMDAY